MYGKTFYLAIGTDQYGAARLWASGDTRAEARLEMSRAWLQHQRRHPGSVITVEIKAVTSD